MANTKQQLLLLHGALGSEKQFKKLTTLLADQFEIATLNFEGHGGLPIDRDFSINHFVQNLIDYLEEMNFVNVSIFGYSMGGYVAIKAALQTTRIRNIVTLATKFDRNAEATQKEVAMLNPEKIEEKIPHYAEFLNQLHQPNNWKVVMRQTAGMMTKLANGEKLVEEDLEQISIPITIGIGDQDRMVSIAESEWATAYLPNSTLKVLEGVKHPLEQVEHKLLKEHIKNAIK